jgi:hypothetical protein
MEKITFTIKDPTKKSFLLELLKQFDFIEIQRSKKEKANTDPYDFFASAGLWRDREVNAAQLREKAWKRSR